MEYIKYISFYFFKIKILILLLFELFLGSKVLIALYKTKKVNFYVISHILIMVLLYYSYFDFAYMITVITLYLVSTKFNFRIFKKIKFIDDIYSDCEKLKSHYKLNEFYVLADYNVKVRHSISDKSIYRKYKRKEASLQDKIIKRILTRILMVSFLIPIAIFFLKPETWEKIIELMGYTGSYLHGFAAIVGGIAQLGIFFMIFLVILYFLFVYILVSLYKYPIYKKRV